MRIFWVVNLGFLLLFSAVQAQSVLKGKVVDAATGQPVAGAALIDTVNHKAGITDTDGTFRFAVHTFPLVLEVKHVSFDRKIVRFSSIPREPIIIELNARMYDVGEVTVRADPVIDLIEKRPLYVFDYAFYRGQVLLLAYYQKQLSKPWLLMFTREGDSIAALPVKRPRALFKDCTDHVHLICQNKVFQIEFDGTDLSLWYPTLPEEFEESMKPCIEKLGSNYYFNQYLYKNQMLIYFYFDDKNKLYKDLIRISDSLKLFLLQDEARFASMGEYNEFDKLFADMIIYAPVYAPLCKVDTFLYVFDFTNSRLVTFTQGGD